MSNTKSPFCYAAFSNLYSLRKKVRKFYGVKNADEFFLAQKQGILNQCKPDPYGFRFAGSLQEWHEMQQEKFKYDLMPRQGAVEAIK